MEKCELIENDGSVVEFFIDEDMRDRLHSLTDHQYSLLKESIKVTGHVSNPLSMWVSEQGLVLIDGHHRYKVIQELKAEGWRGKKGETQPTCFTDHVMELKGCDKQAVLDWIDNRQKGRRNLNLFGNIRLALRSGSTITKQYQDAFFKAVDKGDDKDFVDLLKRVDPKATSITPAIKKKFLESTGRNMDGVIAFALNTNYKYVQMVRFILATGSPDLIDQLSKSDKVSIAQAYKELKASKAPTKPPKPAPIVLCESGSTKMIKKGDNVYISGPINAINKATFMKLLDTI